MGRSTVHYADSETNNILKKLHNKLRPAGTPVQRVEYIIELLLLRIFEVKLTQDPEFAQLRAAFKGENENLLFNSLGSLPNEQILPALNQKFFPFYAHILNEARKVWKGNLSTKVQDQLVLIEEVFSNSNFSNNVTSGNMAVTPSSRRCQRRAARKTSACTARPTTSGNSWWASPRPRSTTSSSIRPSARAGSCSTASSR